MRFKSLVLICAFALGLSSCSSDSTETRTVEAPDMILTNGKILTVDSSFTIAEALAISGDRIVAVGDSDTIEALAGDATIIHDLGGRTVLPGLIDNHTHFIRGTEYWEKEARLDGVTTRAEAKERLASRLETLTDGQWLFSLGGWIEDQFTDDKSHFTLEELDALAGNRPIFLQAKYDHAHVNSFWLDAMGIDSQVDPGVSEDGLAAFVERDEDGKATGRLDGGFPMVGQAMRRFPEVSEEEQVGGIRAAMDYFNSMGVTSLYDGGGSGIRQSSYDRIASLAAKEPLNLRIFHTLWGGLLRTPEEAEALIERIRQTEPFNGTDYFKQLAVGEVYYAPFHWDDVTRVVNPSSEDIAAGKAILVAAAETGWSVETHLIQGESMDIFFDVVEEVNLLHPITKLRWSITHADNIGATQLARGQALGMVFQLRSEPVIGGRDKVHDFYGEAAFDMPPLRMIAESGASFGLGTDGTKASQLNPFVTLWWAVTGKELDGSESIRQLLSREEALIAHTRANAYIVFEEENLGQISAGYLADLIVLDRDYLTIPDDEIRQIRPVATMLGGRIVYGKL